MGISEIDLTGYGKRINLEMGTELQIELSDVAMPLYSTLIGMDTDEYLIIKSPTPYNMVKQKLYRGNEIVVKYLYNGTIYAFQSKLIEPISKPFKLLFLEYPKIIEKHELRSFKRAKCFFPAKMIFDKRDCTGLVLDISRRGCRIQIQFVPGESYPIFKIDEQINLYCKFPGIEGDIEISGTLRNLKKTKHEATLGISFSKTNPEEINNIITKYIFSIFESY